MAKIFLAIPTYDRKVDIEIMLMILQLPTQYPEHEFRIDFIASSIITDSRNFLTRRFLGTDCDWMYFWDSDVVIRDMSFMGMLLQTAKKLNAQVVGGVYRIKHDRGLYAAGNFNKNGDVQNFKIGQLKKPILCDCIATGSMLIKREVVEKLKEPWFQFAEKKNRLTLSEDFNFCKNAKAKGFQVALDPRFNTYHFGYSSWEHSLSTE